MNFWINLILPLFYWAISSWLLIKSNFLRSGGFSPKVIVLLFSGKCISGIIGVYIFLYYLKNGGDVKFYHIDGLALYNMFIHNHLTFLNELNKLFTINDISLLDSKSSFIQGAFSGI